MSTIHLLKTLVTGNMLRVLELIRDKLEYLILGFKQKNMIQNAFILKSGFHN